MIVVFSILKRRGLLATGMSFGAYAQYKCMFQDAVKTFDFWQQDNQALELNGNEMLQQKLLYLHDNSIKSSFFV